MEEHVLGVLLAVNLADYHVVLDHDSLKHLLFDLFLHFVLHNLRIHHLAKTVQGYQSLALQFADLVVAEPIHQNGLCVCAISWLGFQHS